MVSTEDLLGRAGYEYFKAMVEPRVEPEYSRIRFEDVHPGFRRTRLAGQRMWRHQVEALEALAGGSNLILVSGTGSGKTESWVSYIAMRLSRGGPVPRVVAVYPTLALAWDQLRRLEEYGGALGFNVVGVDAEAKRRVRGLARLVREATVVATNPAMLFYELKKHLARPGSSLFTPVFESVDLLVLDELDFYDPRSLHLLLGVVAVLSKLRGSLQVAVLTATLANPEDLAGLLREYTGRDSTIVSGRPFHPENRVYVVIGRGLENVRLRAVEEAERRRLRLPEEIAEALRDPEEFARKAYLVLDYFEAQGVELPGVGLDLAEILSWYAAGSVEPEGVTLVFTRSINEAERLTREVETRYPEARGRIAAHHHLVSREERAKIEEAARTGELRVIVSPRTLSQGVDIGTVVRVVHVGLPDSLREYRQREGRKGRRPSIPYTETIIVPRRRWDRDLLHNGPQGLVEWLTLPPERVHVDPENHYMALFTGAAKLVSPYYRRAAGPLTSLEREALEAAGVLKSGTVDEVQLKRLWHNLNFYEYGPPYGVKRVLQTSSGERVLEPVGRCDLVEKFQEGCLDPANDAVVVKLVTAGRTGTVVSRIVEKPLGEALAERDPPWLLEAVEEYRYVKARWGEEARLLADFRRGSLSSEAETVVYSPEKGFGRLRKVPYRCVWTARRRRPSVSTVGGRVRIYWETASIHVPGRVAGQYTDYTYGYLVQAPPGLSADMVRLALATLGVYLRLAYGVPLGHVKYSVYALGDTVLFEVHEESAGGILKTLDWQTIALEMRDWNPPGIAWILMEALDEYAYQQLAITGWDPAKEAAARVAEAIASVETIEVRLAGFQLRVPKPSRTLKIGALSASYLQLEQEGLAAPTLIGGVGYYDGSAPATAIDMIFQGLAARPPRSLLDLESRVDEDIVYEGFTLVVWDKKATGEAVEALGLRRLARHVEDALDVAEQAVEAGLPRVPPETILETLDYKPPHEMPEKPTLTELVKIVGEAGRRGTLPAWARKIMEAHLAWRAFATYVVYLAVREAG